MWSHEADEPAKVAWREKAARNFEAKNPDVKVKITWYDKPALNAALQDGAPRRPGARHLLRRAGPDRVHHQRVRHCRSTTWSTGATSTTGRGGCGPTNGKTYGLPQEAYTIELYYNKELMKKIGVTLPPNGQVGQAQFLDIVKKANAAGITPISQGVGDRPYPGVYMSEEALLRKLGRDDYGKLLAGKLSYKDPRVVESLTFVKGLVDAGAYPEELRHPQARRVPLLLPHQARVAHVPDGELLHRAGVRAAGQGRPAGELPARRHGVPGDGPAAPATSARA